MYLFWKYTHKALRDKNISRFPAVGLQDCYKNSYRYFHHKIFRKIIDFTKNRVIKRLLNCSCNHNIIRFLPHGNGIIKRQTEHSPGLFSAEKYHFKVEQQNNETLWRLFSVHSYIIVLVNFEMAILSAGETRDCWFYLPLYKTQI